MGRSNLRSLNAAALLTRSLFPWIAGIVLCCHTIVVAASTGLPFLRLSSGARGSALGEAVTALTDIEAMSYNPAALSSNIRGASIGHSEWIRGISHQYLSLLRPLGVGTVALSGAFSQVDDIERRTGPTVRPLGKFGVYNTVFGLGYARDLSPRLRWGIGVKLVRQSIFTASANGFAFDFGALYAVAPDLQLALAVRNLGTMSKLASKSTDLPTEARIGMAYGGLGKARLSADLQQAHSTRTSVHLGAEYLIQHRLALRAGYQTTDRRDFSIGLGLETGIWSFDYAFVPFASGLGEAHRIGLRYQGSF